MNRITHVKQQVLLEQFKDILAERTRSGMTVKEFCRYHHMAESTYYRYLKQVRTKAIANLPAHVPESVSETTDLQQPSFSPLEVRQTAPNSDKKDAIIIHLPSAVVEVPDGVAPQTLEAVLNALRNVC